MNTTKKPKEAPSLSVIIASRDEPLEVIKMTVNSALSINYPKEKIKIIFTDNSREDNQYKATVDYFAELRKSNKNVHFIHRNSTKGFKAGNIDFALKRFRSDYILFLDVDNQCGTYSKIIGNYIHYLEQDRNCAFIQFSNQPSKEYENKINKIFCLALLVNKAEQEEMSSVNGGFTYFQGHSCLWRESSIRLISPLAQTFANRPMVVEDLHAAINIQLRSQTAKQSEQYGTFYAPITIENAEKMLTRWMLGTNQLFFKTFKEVSTSLLKPKTRAIGIEVLSQFSLEASRALLPYFVIAGGAINTQAIHLYSAALQMVDIVIINVLLRAFLFDNRRRDKKSNSMELISSLIYFNALAWCARVKGLLTVMLPKDYNWVPTQKTMDQRKNESPNIKSDTHPTKRSIKENIDKSSWYNLIPAINLTLIIGFALISINGDILISGAPLIYYSFTLIAFARLEAIQQKSENKSSFHMKAMD